MRSVIFILSVTISPLALAEDILNLQQKTSFAYDQMIQAEREAEMAEYQIKAKQEQLQYFKQKVVEAEQELKIAQEESSAARKKREVAKNKWEELSDTLAQEWRKQENR